MELIKKYERKKENIEGLIKAEQEGRYVNVVEIEKLHAVLRFIDEFINDLKRVNTSK